VSAPPAGSRVSAEAVTLRPAEASDARRLWSLRNDEAVRRASLDPAPIPWSTHERWFRQSLERDDRRIYVIEVECRPEGAARLDIAGDEAAISIYLAAEWRGRGVGPLVLRRLVEIAFRDLGIRRLVASVKADNHASVSAFIKAGFTRVSEGPVLTFRREPER
jgi:RimJ/RimL family protein N-acetyltransferase